MVTSVTTSTFAKTSQHTLMIALLLITVMLTACRQTTSVAVPTTDNHKPQTTTVITATANPDQGTSTPQTTAYTKTQTDTPRPHHIPIKPLTQDSAPSPALFIAPDSALADSAPITTSNAAKLQALAWITNVPIDKLYWSHDKGAFAIVHPDAVHVYGINPMTENVLQIAGPTLPTFSPDESDLSFATSGKDGTVLFWNATSGKRSTFFANSAKNLSLAISPDGSTLASLKADGTVVSWNTVDGHLLKTIGQDHWPAITPLQEQRLIYHPGGNTLALISRDQSEIHLWDVPKGEALRTLQWTNHAGPIYDVVFTHDWHTLAWVSRATIQLMNFAEAELGPSLDHEDAVSGWRFSTAGTLIAVRSAETINGNFAGVVKLWDYMSGKSRHTFTHGDYISTMAFSTDWQIAATASSQGEITLWDATTGEALRTLRGHTDMVLSLAFAPGAEVLASASADGTIRIWDIDNGIEITTLSRHASPVVIAEFSPEGGVLISAAEDGRLYIWGTKPPPKSNAHISTDNAQSLHAQSHFNAEQVVSLDFSSHGLVTGSQTGKLTLWDAHNGKELWAATAHEGWVYGLAASPDGTVLVSSGQDGIIRAWDTTTGQLLRTIDADAGEISSVDYSRDGTIIATGAQDGSVDCWDITSGEKLTSLAGHSDWVWDVAFAPDGHVLASASADGTVKLWDLTSGREKTTLTGHTATVWSVAISADGSTVASGSWDGTSKLWDINSGQLLYTLSGHDDWVYDVEFSPSSQLLVSTSRDGVLKLWDVDQGQHLWTSPANNTDSIMRNAAFSPNGEMLATTAMPTGTSADGIVRVWGIPN